MKKIENIVCATIGSKSCMRAEDKAIDLAKENNAELTFLYVVDLTFLDGIFRYLHGKELDSEIERIGNLILDRAVEKARAQGVKAEKLITHGIVHEEIEKAVIELNADILVIGDEKRGWLEEHLTKGVMEHFIKSISEKTGVEIIVVK